MVTTAVSPAASPVRWMTVSGDANSPGADRKVARFDVGSSDGNMDVPDAFDNGGGGGAAGSAGKTARETRWREDVRAVHGLKLTVSARRRGHRETGTKSVGSTPALAPSILGARAVLAAEPSGDGPGSVCARGDAFTGIANLRQTLAQSGRVLAKVLGAGAGHVSRAAQRPNPRGPRAARRRGNRTPAW